MKSVFFINSILQRISAFFINSNSSKEYSLFKCNPKLLLIKIIFFGYKIIRLFSKSDEIKTGFYK